jgi:hypothetical protein
MLQTGAYTEKHGYRLISVPGAGGHNGASCIASEAAD